MSRTTMAVTTTTSTGASRIRPRIRLSAVTNGSGSVVGIALASTSLSYGRGNRSHPARRHVRNDARQQANQQRGGSQQAHGESLAPDRISERRPVFSERSKEDRAQAPQDVSSRNRNRAHAQDCGQR